MIIYLAAFPLIIDSSSSSSSRWFQPYPSMLRLRAKLLNYSVLVVKEVAQQTFSADPLPPAMTRPSRTAVQQIISVDHNPLPPIMPKLSKMAAQQTSSAHLNRPLLIKLHSQFQQLLQLNLSHRLTRTKMTLKIDTHLLTQRLQRRPRLPQRRVAKQPCRIPPKRRKNQMP